MESNCKVSSDIAEVAESVGAPLRLEGRDWFIDDAPAPAMAGAFQRRNAGLATEMIRMAGMADEAAIASGIASALWPGRLQLVSPGPLTALAPNARQIWLDGAHNEAAGAALCEFFRDHDRRAVHVITGILANKDARGLLSHFGAIAERVTVIPIPGHAHHDPAEIAALASSLGLESATAKHVEEALAATSAQTVLIAGSLYLAGEVLRLNEQQPN